MRRIPVFISVAAITLMLAASLASGGVLMFKKGTPLGVPVNTSIPTIAGTAQVGQTLTAAVGSWTNSPTSYTYQWTDTTTGAIGGATASTYIPVTGNIGDTLTVTVVASNGGGSSSPAISSATSAVTPSSGISANFFGVSLLGPIETNFSGHPLVWPNWAPTTFRVIDNFGGVPPNYAYQEGVSEWASVEITTSFTIGGATTFVSPGGVQLFTNGQKVQLHGSVPGGFTADTVTYCVVGVSGLNFSLATSPGCGAGIVGTGSNGSCQIFDWSLFDLAWAKLIAKGVTNIDFAFQAIPQWAEVGNAYSFSGATITSASPAVVTATGNQYVNGWRVFFAPGGTLPTGLTAGTYYYVVHNGTDGTGKFRLALTSGGADINTTGSAGTSTVTAGDTPPASQTTLTNWVTAYLNQAALDGLQVKFVEGLNEPNDGPGFYVGTQAELVTMQQTIYNAAKAVDSTIKVLSPPVNTVAVVFGQNYTQAFLAAGGGAFCDIIAYHGYPEDPGTNSQTLYNTHLAAFITMLNANGQSGKPLWNTEYSTGAGPASADETYLSTTTFIDLVQGVARKYYYSYDGTSTNDPLWVNPNNSPPQGALNIAGIAQQNIIGWLTGATLTSGINMSGVVWSVNLTLSNSVLAQVVWTTDGSTPAYTVPGGMTQYYTLAGGNVSGLGSTVQIGANPILLTGSGGLPVGSALPAYANAVPNWQNAGLVLNGGIPARTQCGATLTPSGGDDLSQITSAIAACSSNQFVQLGAGTFLITMSESILVNKSITLRGTGTCNNGSSPYCQTVIKVSNGQLPTYAAGGQCGTDTSHIVSCVLNAVIDIQPENRFNMAWSGCPNSTNATGCSTALDVDASQGQTTIQVHSLTNLSVGKWVRIDEASGAVSQQDPSQSSGHNVFAATDFTASSGSPATGKIAYAGVGVEVGNAYGALYDRETSEIHLISAVGAGPCPGTACTITFDSPLTVAYRQSGNHFAQVYWPTDASSTPISFLTQAGVENLSITGATQGPIYMTFCAYCWISNVEASGWSSGIGLSNVARSELIGSYIHDCYDCENNGTEYPIAIDGATTETLVANNILRLGGKGMVARSTGGGNVVSYNYQDDTFYMAAVIGNYWLDLGINGSHYVGSHHMLFEGNYGTNCDNDEIHGNAVYHTFFRNWCTGLRTNFNDPSFTTSTSSTFNPTDAPVSDVSNIGFATGNSYPYSGGTAIKRAATSERWIYWMTFMGNVLGESGVTTSGNGWSYQATTETNKNIWMLGWAGGECPGCSDNNLNGTTGSYYFRHGNYDYLHNSIFDWQGGFTHTLPNSFYLPTGNAPPFFSPGATCTYPWPWVTPTSGTVIQSNSCSGSGNPAQARWNAGTPFVQP